jgi:tetratricopeptide (TPR) repeat protein
MMRLVPAALAACFALPASAQTSWTPPVPPGCPQAPADATEARALAGEFFQRAAARDQTGEYDLAVSFYECCYHIMAHPNTLYNLALAAEKAGDVRTAQRALERYLAEAPDALNRDEAEALLATVQSRVAALPPEQPAQNPTEIGPENGGVEPPVVPPVQNPVQPPVETGPTWMTWTGWTLVGVGVAGLAVGGGMAAWSVDLKDTVENSPPDTPWVDVSSSRDDYDTAQAVMIAGFVAGGVLAAGGALLLILDAGGEEETDGSDAALVPVVSAESVGLGVVGRF